jgi:hypothetical protein
VAFLTLLPAILSYLVLGAHFLRGGHWVLVALCLALAGALAFRRRWVAILAQVTLVLAALEWVRTLLLLLEERRSLGEPYLRMVLILGGVAAFTLASAFLFHLPVLKRRYGPSQFDKEG